jgi:hypothetical protein
MNFLDGACYGRTYFYLDIYVRGIIAVTGNITTTLSNFSVVIGNFVATVDVAAVDNFASVVSNSTIAAGNCATTIRNFTTTNTPSDRK